MLHPRLSKICTKNVTKCSRRWSIDRVYLSSWALLRWFERFQPWSQTEGAERRWSRYWWFEQGFHQRWVSHFNGLHPKLLRHWYWIKQSHLQHYWFLVLEHQDPVHRSIFHLFLRLLNAILAPGIQRGKWRILKRMLVILHDCQLPFLLHWIHWNENPRYLLLQGNMEHFGSPPFHCLPLLRCY